jgi:hypothetical protein
MPKKEASAGPSFGDSYATHSAVAPRRADDCMARMMRKVEPREVAVGRRAIAFVGLLTAGLPRRDKSRPTAACAASDRPNPGADGRRDRGSASCAPAWRSRAQGRRWRASSAHGGRGRSR